MVITFTNSDSKTKNFTLECHEKLVPLLQRSFPNVEVKPEDRSLDMNRDDFDYHLPMGSLYKHFLEEITENPKPKAYLVPDPDRVNYWRERLKSLGKGPYIGIAWKSSNMSPQSFTKLCTYFGVVTRIKDP